MINLDEKYKVLLLEIADSTFTNEVEIRAFGSRVNGTNHESSDLDIVLKSTNNSEIPIDELALFGERIKTSSIPILIDYFDWERIPESFQNNILKKYEILN